MSITIGDKPEMNVVNVGDELTQDQLAALQNAQGASATNPCLTRTNTFNTADAAVRITQEGTGDAFRVEDEANPDASPLRVTSTGKVGINVSDATLNARTGTLIVGAGANANACELTGRLLIDATHSTNSFEIINSGSGSSAVFRNTATATADAVRITNTGTGNSFVVNDEAGDTTNFVIDNAGNVTLGGTLTFADGTTQSTATTGGGGSYDQSLNTTDNVTFNSVGINPFQNATPDVGLDSNGLRCNVLPSYNALYVGDDQMNYGTSGLIIQDGNLAYAETRYTNYGITFQDGTFQSTAAGGNTVVEGDWSMVDGTVDGNQIIIGTQGAGTANININNFAVGQSSIVINPDSNTGDINISAVVGTPVNVGSQAGNASFALAPNKVAKIVRGNNDINDSQVYYIFDIV